MFSYVAYGIGINSSIPLPELLPERKLPGSTEEVLVREGPVPGVPPEARLNDHYIQIETTDAYLHIPHIGTLLVRQGREVIVARAPQVTDEAVRLFLLGAALAMILHQRGHLVLHASATGLRTGVNNYGAVAFLGHSGQGKSTMAAALYDRGHSAITDDIVAIPARYVTRRALETAREGPLIAPGFPAFKLAPESRASLRHAADRLTPLHAARTPDLRSVNRVTAGFITEAVPLRRIYVLEEGAAMTSELLPPPEALVQLLRHSYWVATLPRSQSMSHFQQCAALAQRVPVHRLQRPRDLSRLSDVARIIEADESARAH